MKSYELEKQIFLEIKKCFQNPKYQKHLKEFVKLINELYLSYDPAINENKFIIGHSCEIFLAVLLRSFKFNVTRQGSNELGYDLLINESKFSLKSLSKVSQIRLKNIHGNNQKFHLEYATLVLILGTGLIYFDPRDLINLKINLKQVSDGFDISAANLKKIIKNKFNVIKIPKLKSKKQIYEDNSQSIKNKVASETISKIIMEEYANIFNKFKDK